MNTRWVTLFSLLMSVALLAIFNSGVLSTTAQTPTHILIAEAGRGRIIEIDKNTGDIVWQISGYESTCAARVSNGNTLICDRTRVVEVNPVGEVIWSTSGFVMVMDAVRLSNGNTLISDGEGGRVVEIQPDGSEIWSYDGLHWPEQAVRLPNGNTLIADGTSIVKEITSDGTIVGAIFMTKWACSVQRLSDGNTLVGESLRVDEVDSSGNIIWSKDRISRICSVQRLSNGNTLIAENDTNRVVEFDPSGAIVWSTPIDLCAPWKAQQITVESTYAIFGPNKTNNTGNYSLRELKSGFYPIKPSKNDYTFLPTFHTIEPAGQNLIILQLPPMPPSNLQATPLNSFEIRLDWNDNSNDEVGFQIYDGDCPMTIEANTTSYIDGDLEPNSYHCYTIRAFNDFASPSDFSDWTDWACTTTPEFIFNVAVIPSETLATISWNTDEPATSQVEYGISSPSISTMETTNYVTSHSVALTDLSPNTTYVYRVRSKDTDGHVATSEELSFITQAPPPLFSISGRVTNNTGNSIAGVTISTSGGYNTTTDGNGNYTLSELTVGTYTITPYKNGYTFNPASRTVNVPPNATSKNFNGYDKPPIVFVHGWTGFPFHLWESCGWPKPEVYFEEVDDDLKTYYPVFYAQLETSRCFTPRLIQNITRLRNAIQLAKATTNQPKVILITHSMGGLVSRAYIESPDYASDVAALFTFGSPHHGISPDLLTFLVLSANTVSLGYYCEHNQPAVCDFSAVGMSSFNKSHLPWTANRTAEVDYHLISGNAPFFSRNTWGQIMDELIDGIAFGPDDGITPAGSGLGSGLSGKFDRFVTDENHNVFGIEDENNKKHYFNSYFYIRENGEKSISYTQCLKKVLIDKTSPACGSVSTQQAMAQDAPPSARTPFGYGTLLAGQTVARTISLEGGSTLFATHWQTGTLTVTLINPNGQIIDPAFAASHPSVVTYDADANAATYYFPNAITGQWQLKLEGSSIPSGGSTYITLAAFDSSLVLTGATDKDEYGPGAIATITASLVGSPTNATVTATILNANGNVQTINLTSTGGSNFQGVYSVPNVLGYVEVRLVATGTTTSGIPFERGKSLIFQISPDDGGTIYLPIIF